MLYKIPVFILHDNGLFIEHRTSTDKNTVCGILFSDIRPVPTYSEIDDDRVYWDHDRADVKPCIPCGVLEVSWVGAY